MDSHTMLASSQLGGTQVHDGRHVGTKRKSSRLGDWIMVGIMVVVGIVLEFVPQGGRVIHPEELWQYSYPIMHSTVPTWALMLLSYPLPLLVIMTLEIRKEVNDSQFIHRTLLGLSSAFAMTLMVTNVGKVWVGRPRPYYATLCWPPPTPKLDPGQIFTKTFECPSGASLAALAEARRSFPSGHSSLSAAGLLFLALYLWRYLRVAGDGGSIWRLVVAACPVALALGIALSRVVDYHHHPTDVLSGLVIGSTIAVLHYRQTITHVTLQAAHAHASSMRDVTAEELL